LPNRKINPGSAELGGIVNSLPSAFASEGFAPADLDANGQISMNTKMGVIFEKYSCNGPINKQFGSLA